MTETTKAALLPALLLAELEAGGFAVAAAGGKLTVSPASKLTASQRDAVKLWRDDLLVILAERADLGKAVAAARDAHPPRRVGWVLKWP